MRERDKVSFIDEELHFFPILNINLEFVQGVKATISSLGKS